MRNSRAKLLLLLSAFWIAGCSGYLAENYDSFKANVASEYPVGSEVAVLSDDLMRRGFRLSGPAWKPTQLNPDPLQNCLKKTLIYGFWASGHRYVCFEPTAEGQIAEIRVFQLVAGL